MRFYFLILVLLSLSTFGQDCNREVEKIFNKIIESIGDNSILTPSLEFSNEENSVAYMTIEGITIEQKVINLFCDKEYFKNSIAYILSHELAHYYLKHSWMSNTGLGYASSIGEFIDEKKYSKEQRKLSESQADLYAGFYGQISGYNTLEYAEKTLNEIYDSYSLPNELPGYPSYDERIEIINSKIKIANQLSNLFELGNVLLLSKKFIESSYCFEYILRNNFNSREIYNNLGLAYLLYGISISKPPINSLLFPISLDQQTRLKVNITRSANFTEKPDDMIKYALKQFKKSQLLDPKYKINKVNQIVAEFLLLPDNKSKIKFIQNNKNKYPKITTDLEVINMIENGESINKITKKSKSGTKISELNLSKSTQINQINSNDIIKKLGISLMDILMFKGLRIADSKFKIGYVNDIQIFDCKEFYVIKIPDELIKSNLFKQKPEEIFTKSGEGYYMIYNTQ